MATENEFCLAIGEVARLTGVNPVTLRAWQRRFGLVTPQRTPKGHRLYSQAQVDEIKEILHWLAQGVAISRVKPLLSSAEGHAEIAINDDADWQQLAKGLDDAVMALKAVTLRQRLDELTSLYPMPLCGEKLADWLQTIEANLALRVDGGLISQWLARQLQLYLAIRTDSVIRQKPQQVLLLALQEHPQHALWVWQLALLAQGKLPLLFDRSSELDSLPLLMERLQPTALLVLPAAHTHASLLHQLSELASKLSLSTALCGKFASLLQPQLSQDTNLTNLSILDSVVQLPAWLMATQEVSA
ncbi:MerR family transcriptional regulator [Shewanella avicenniae]|uniref:MerR family transcriptional regulator n=1 Tax=Shewanella avicenniae TaxID=2814294 RepID=A0ABX7QU63_9GAMM|nr:MerR family transcriptional regulator [Shewanella avicenniae]QSX34567.1 MerR family transcriptional regulator [Shewanella avicenniae]